MSEQEHRVRLAEAQDFRDTFESLPGMRTLERLKQFCHIDHTTIAAEPGGSIDPYKTIFREGERNVMLFILGQIRSADEKIDRPATAETENDGTE